MKEIEFKFTSRWLIFCTVPLFKTHSHLSLWFKILSCFPVCVCVYVCTLSSLALPTDSGSFTCSSSSTNCLLIVSAPYSVSRSQLFCSSTTHPSRCFYDLCLCTTRITTLWSPCLPACLLNKLPANLIHSSITYLSFPYLSTVFYTH